MGLAVWLPPGALRTTPLGEEVLRGHMDVQSNLLVSVASRLGIKEIGLIAAAFLTSKKDLFSDVLQSGPEFGLDTRQVALGESAGFVEDAGDVHTAVRWYLEWVRASHALREDVRSLLRIACFRKMAQRAPVLTASEAGQLLATREWSRPLTVSLAFAYPRNVLHLFGEAYKTTLPTEDAIRVSLDLPALGANLAISNHSVCSPRYRTALAAWVVYAGAARFPFMKSVTPLPDNVAGWFTHTPVSWDLEGVSSDSFCAAMACALNSEAPEPLHRFPTLQALPGHEQDSETRPMGVAALETGVETEVAGGTSDEAQEPRGDAETETVGRRGDAEVQTEREEAEGAAALEPVEQGDVAAPGELVGDAVSATRARWRRRWRNSRGEPRGDAEMETAGRHGQAGFQTERAEAGAAAALEAVEQRGEAADELGGALVRARCSAWRRRSDLLTQIRAKLRQSWASSEGDEEAIREGSSCDVVSGRDIFDTEDFVRLVRRLQSVQPDLSSEADALVQEVADDERYPFVNVVMEAAEGLRTTLELLLLPPNLDQQRKLRQQINNYVFFLRASALRRLGPLANGRVALGAAEMARDAEPLLSERGQLCLQEYACAMLRGSPGPCGARAPSSDASVLEGHEMAAAAERAVSRMQSHKGVIQVAAKKLKKPIVSRLKRARQRVQWEAHTVEWMFFQMPCRR